jgi:hypothetical protein
MDNDQRTKVTSPNQCTSQVFTGVRLISFPVIVLRCQIPYYGLKCFSYWQLWLNCANCISHSTQRAEFSAIVVLNVPLLTNCSRCVLRKYRHTRTEGGVFIHPLDLSKSRVGAVAKKIVCRMIVDARLVSLKSFCESYSPLSVVQAMSLWFWLKYISISRGRCSSAYNELVYVMTVFIV